MLKDTLGIWESSWYFSKKGLPPAPSSSCLVQRWKRRELQDFTPSSIATEDSIILSIRRKPKAAKKETQVSSSTALHKHIRKMIHEVDGFRWWEISGPGQVASTLRIGLRRVVFVSLVAFFSLTEADHWMSLHGLASVMVIFVHLFVGLHRVVSIDVFDTFVCWVAQSSLYRCVLHYLS